MHETRRIGRRATALALWLTAAAALGQSRPAGPARADVERAIELGGDYLARACKPDGQFVYRIHLDSTVTLARRYNVLRHAGAIYALAQRHQWRPQKATKDAMLRAADFLRKRCIGPVPGQQDLLAVWSDPKMTGTRSPLTAKLGGAGLALVALCSIEKVAPGTTPPADLRKLGAFIRFMQKADGSFYSKFIPAAGGRDDSWTSLYYPGEAALGLLMLHQRDPQKTWLQAAADAIGFLAAGRKDQARVPPDHWAMLATARLLPLYDQIKPPVPRERLIAHAVQVCESLLDIRQVIDPTNPARGCFSTDGRTTPTATRLEGLLAAQTFLPAAQDALRKRIDTVTAPAIAFLLQSQVPIGPNAGAVPHAIGPLPGTSEVVLRLNRRAGEVRIDYVQHFVSAMLGYLERTGKQR